MATWTYRLPWPPSVNSYWRKGGKVTYLTKRAREYRKEVLGAIIEHHGGVWEHCVSAKRLAVNIECVMPDRRKRDLDNHIKGLLDSLQHVHLFYDDEQVDELRIKRLYIEPPGCVDVTITEL